MKEEKLEEKIAFCPECKEETKFSSYQLRNRANVVNYCTKCGRIETKIETKVGYRRENDTN